VKLDVLACGDVTELARISLTDIGEDSELRTRNDPLRNLDAQHLGVRALALSVGAAHETEGAPLIGGYFAPLVFLQRGDELVDVRLAGERQSRATVCGQFLFGSHGSPRTPGAYGHGRVRAQRIVHSVRPGQCQVGDFADHD